MIEFDIGELVGELKKLVYNYLIEYINSSPSLKLSKLRFKLQLESKSDNSSILRIWLDNLLSGSDDILVDYDVSDYSFKIGNVEIKNPIVSAPLAGISDNTYRIFARFFGAALTYSEMVTSYGIYYNHKKSLHMTNITNYERPCALQIFGSDPDIMSEAALMLEDKADIIDINMGCPVPKILKSKSGGYLLQDEERIEAIISKIASVVKKPVTVKVRIGWDKNSINILKIAKIAESSGAAAIAIHGRTVKQGFSGEVNYEVIKKTKNNVNIPVMISGDINTPQKAKEVLEYTSCDGIMIGRASRGNVWVLLNILLSIIYKDNISEKPDGISKRSNFIPSISWRKEFAVVYLKFLIYFKGEYKAVREYRKHLSWIFKGVRGISKARKELFKIKSFEDAVNVIENIGGK